MGLRVGENYSRYRALITLTNNGLTNIQASISQCAQTDSLPIESTIYEITAGVGRLSPVLFSGMHTLTPFIAIYCEIYEGVAYLTTHLQIYNTFDYKKFTTVSSYSDSRRLNTTNLTIAYYLGGS